ncbi:MAG: hypothetical protein R3F61_02810 [Myxococcota bacterium]
MTIAVLTLHLVDGGWSIRTPDGAVEIRADEACLAGRCKPTGELTIDERGMWHLASIDVDLRWASADTVEVRTADSSWLAADFTTGVSLEGPVPAVPEEVTRWDRGVLPGLWFETSEPCRPPPAPNAGAPRTEPRSRAATGWLYQPLIAEAPGSFVQSKGGVPVVTPVTPIAPCKSGGTRDAGEAKKK